LRPVGIEADSEQADPHVSHVNYCGSCGSISC
jgi:hypothetical protein